MIHLLKLVLDWSTQPAVLATLVGLSVTSFVASVIGVPWYLRRLPADYFAHHRQGAGDDEDRSVAPWRLALGVLRNALGAVLLIAGVAMLVLPGQGIATILVGLLMMDFPRKKQLQRRVLSMPPVLRTVNTLRKRAGEPPLVMFVAEPPPIDLETHPPHSHPSSAR